MFSRQHFACVLAQDNIGKKMFISPQTTKDFIFFNSGHELRLKKQQQNKQNVNSGSSK